MKNLNKAKYFLLITLVIVSFFITKTTLAAFPVDIDTGKVLHEGGGVDISILGQTYDLTQIKGDQFEIVVSKDDFATKIKFPLLKTDKSHIVTYIVDNRTAAKIEYDAGPMDLGFIYKIRLEEEDGTVISNTKEETLTGCKVISAVWSPSGLYPYKTMVNTDDKTPFVVHMKIKTQGCNGKFINIHIRNKGAVYDSTVSDVEQSLNRVEIDENESLDLSILPGENGCVEGAGTLQIKGCTFYILIDKSNDGAVESFSSDDENHKSLLKYGACDGYCGDPWIFSPSSTDLG